MAKCERVLIFVDQLSKVVPIFSTITSLVDLFQKHVLLCNKDVSGNRYYEHIKKQSSWISIGVSIPILGNLGYICYKIFIYFKNKEKPVESEVLQENTFELTPEEPIEIGEELKPLSEMFNEFLNTRLVGYLEVLNEDKLNALFDVAEEELNLQEQALEDKEEAFKNYTILKNIYLLDLIKENGKLRGDEIYVIEHSQLNHISKFREAVEEAFEYKRKWSEQQKREEEIKNAKREDCVKVLAGCLELKIGDLFEYLASLTQNDLDCLYQLDQFLKDPSQQLFAPSEIEGMVKRIEESERKWLFSALINICNGQRSGEKERVICQYLLIQDIKIVGLGEGFISEPVEDPGDEKDDVIEGVLSIHSYQEKLNEIKLESNKKIEELKQDWKQWFDFKKSGEKEKERECKEKIATLVNKEKEKAENLLKKDWSKRNEKWEGFDLIIGKDEEESPIEPVVMEMIRTEQDFLNKLSKFKIFLEKLPEDERWNKLIENTKSIIEHSEIMERNLSSTPSWKSALEGFEPNRVKELFMALHSFEVQAHELRKTINDLDNNESVKEVILEFIEEMGEEECRKIGVGNAGVFSSIMGNFLMAPIQRSMRYRLTFQEFMKNATQHQEEFPLMYAATERRLQALVLLCAMLNLLHPSN